MSTRLCYAVIATLPNSQLADEYVAWLEDGHVDAVVKGGAHSAMIVRLHAAHPTPGVAAPVERRVMTQYIFTTREVFDQYVTRHAPALRADGLKRFGPERGVSFERLLGDIV